MVKKRLADMSFGAFQEKLVLYCMEEIEEKALSPLVYFPIVHERVESFLLAHWSYVWENCSHMKWEQWLQSPCFTLFHDEVIYDLIHEITTMEKKPTAV